MSVRKEPWPQGTPAWVDLMVPDVRAAQDFYGPLFGWEFDVGTPETGYYTMCLKDGEAVAGLGQPTDVASAAPPAWTTYLAADDVDAVAAKVGQAGGQLLVEPMDVQQFGRMAVATDPTGAVFGLWQSGTHTGADRVNEPGSVTWNEVAVGDVERAKDFYAAVFGYSYGDMSGDGFSYATLDLGERPVGGIGDLPEAGAAPQWLTYFATDDADRLVETAVRHGGATLKEPWDTEYGRMAVLRGPFGETFAVMGVGPDAGADGS